MNHEVLAVQNVSRMCMVCGVRNPWGLKGHFLELTGGELLGIFAPLEEHQGYPGRLHGGIVSAILDETIGRAIIIGNADVWGVTAELTVRFRKPVPLDGEIRAVGRITRNTRRVFEGTGEIVLEDGSVAAQACGKYLRMPVDEIAGGDFSEDWFADERGVPDTIESAR